MRRAHPMTKGRSHAGPSRTQPPGPTGTRRPRARAAVSSYVQPSRDEQGTERAASHYCAGPSPRIGPDILHLVLGALRELALVVAVAIALLLEPPSRASVLDDFAATARRKPADVDRLARPRSLCWHSPRRTTPSRSSHPRRSVRPRLRRLCDHRRVGNDAARCVAPGPSSSAVSGASHRMSSRPSTTSHASDSPFKITTIPNFPG